MSSNDHSHDDDYDVHVHISTTKQNLGILALLFALTGLTIACYLVRLGDANLTVALIIAMTKAILVGTFFMHLKYEKPFNTLFFVGTLAFIGVFFVFTHNDTGHRGELDYRNGARFDYRYQEWAQGTAPGIRERNGEELRPAADQAAEAAPEGAQRAVHAAPAAAAEAAPAAAGAAAPAAEGAAAAPAAAAPAAPAAAAPAAPAAPAPAAPAAPAAQ